MDTSKVQHVNKKSSDELLSKFAELGSDSAPKKELRLSRRRKRTRKPGQSDSYRDSPSNNAGAALVERKWLLPPATRRSALLRSQLRAARDIRSKSLMGAIEKTWRKAVEGASRVFMEKHYNRHRRLINDVIL